MRTIKELLQLLLIHFETSKQQIAGLCDGCWDLVRDKIIEPEEYRELVRFIRNNRPKWYSIHYCYSQKDRMYWWKIGNRKPRIKWLKSQIKKLS